MHPKQIFGNLYKTLVLPSWLKKNIMLPLCGNISKEEE
jgi:hypothetical protein